jgi:hypothetical protein
MPCSPMLSSGFPVLISISGVHEAFNLVLEDSPDTPRKVLLKPHSIYIAVPSDQVGTSCRFHQTSGSRLSLRISHCMLR